MIARLYVAGEAWELMGNVVDSFLDYENTIEASRGGRIYSSTEQKPKTITVDEIKIQLSEFEAIKEFFKSCEASTTGFTVTVAMGEECKDGLIEHIYTNCLLSGTPEFSLFEKKIENFEFAYEICTIKGSIS